MSRLLKADLYRMWKSRLTLIALILALAFPLFMVLLYVGIRAMSGLGDEMLDAVSMFNANTVIGSCYSLTNNIGLVVPAFAGILVCTDYSNGTLRNKVIAGNRRSEIYLSHLIVTILFSVVIMTIYTGMTTVFSLLFLPFQRDPSMNLAREVLYFVSYGTMTFVFIATVSTLFAMTFRNAAPTIIFTIVLALLLMILDTVVSLIDYSKYRYIIYAIPTFGANFFTLNNMSITALFSTAAQDPGPILYAEGMLSYVFFGVVNTVIGLLVFCQRDVK